MNSVNFHGPVLTGDSSPQWERSGTPPLDLAAFARPTTQARTGGNRVIGMTVAVAVQLVLLAGLMYGTFDKPPPVASTPLTVDILPQEEDVKPPPPPPIKPIMTTPNVVMNMPPTFQIYEPPPLVAATTPPPADALTSTSVPGGNANAIVEAYQIKLLRHLNRHKRYPGGARAKREQGVVYVRFAMDRQGNVLSAAIEKTCRFVDLDNEGLALLTRAQPLPIPPVEVAGSPIEMIVPVEFSLK